MAEKKRLQSLAALREKEAALLEKLSDARRVLKAAEAAERARKRAAQRREDARRKVLHGVILLSAIDAGYVSRDQVMQWGAQFIKRAGEREFLGLPPLPQEQQRQEE